jgi:putative toxin-antitoxin system antitoxin component (TIGR02293 family)
MTVHAIVAALGGPSVVGSRSAEELRARIKAGLPYASLLALARGLGLGVADLTSVLDLPPRTLARRKREKRLRGDESDRVARLARIVAHAEEVLGDRKKAATWLCHANRALGGRKPIDLLDTDLGVRHVEAVLGRVAHGVYS